MLNINYTEKLLAKLIFPYIEVPISWHRLAQVSKMHSMVFKEWLDVKKEWNYHPFYLKSVGTTLRVTGKNHGIYKRWHRPGNYERILVYLNGELHGRCWYFNDSVNGKYTRCKWYEDYQNGNHIAASCMYRY